MQGKSNTGLRGRWKGKHWGTLKGTEKPRNSKNSTREITIQHDYILEVLQWGSLSICVPFLPLPLVCFLHNLHCRWSSGCQELVLKVQQVCLGLSRLWSWQHPAFLLLQPGSVCCSHGTYWRHGKLVTELDFFGERMGTAREYYSFLSHFAVPVHLAASLLQDHPRTQLVVPQSQTNCLPCSSLPNNMLLDKPTPGLPASWEQNGTHPAKSQPTSVSLPECQRHGLRCAKPEKHLVQDNRFDLLRCQHQPRTPEAVYRANLPLPTYGLLRSLAVASLSGCKSLYT